jgi:hypothetical protein
VSWVAAPSVFQSGSTGLPSSCSPGMAPGTAWPPAWAGLLSIPLLTEIALAAHPDDPSAEDGSDSHKATAAKGLGWSREQQSPGGNEVLAGDADLPHDLLDARDGRAVDINQRTRRLESASQ